MVSSFLPSQQFDPAVIVNVINLPITNTTTAKKTGLDVQFRVTKSVKLEPHTTDVQIYNLAKVTRDQLTRLFDEARNLAFEARVALQFGKVRVLAGYQVPELLSSADIIELYHERDGDEWVTTIKAQDSRVQWANGFVAQTVGPTEVDLQTMKQVAKASASILEGADSEAAFQAALPEYSLKKGSAGFSNGFVMFGPTREKVRDIYEDLGLKAWLDDGRLITISQNAAKLDLAVVLSPRTGLLRATKREGGFFTCETLLNPKLDVGRQVQLQDELGVPLGVGIFRVDNVEWYGSTFGDEFNTRVDLRPSIPGGGV